MCSRSAAIPQVERIYELKRDLIEMKRSIAPLHLPLRMLAERQRDKDLRQYFLDVHDHLEQVREQVANYDELMSSILQAAVARLSVSENEDMRKISAWVAIAAVPTMIAGIYGMNFQLHAGAGVALGLPVDRRGDGDGVLAAVPQLPAPALALTDAHHAVGPASVTWAATSPGPVRTRPRLDHLSPQDQARAAGFGVDRRREFVLGRSLVAALVGELFPDATGWSVGTGVCAAVR